ncbi:hypothetical protein [Microcoleus sp. F10-B2]|uniref:hypothetical protein n=1 Tax=Microcoleus sp. F10-B2 TaxID=2818751 RepID=UPI002FD6E48B
MTIATTDRPKLTAQMGRKEAEQITNDIRANFDSLGKMLLEVRERKGFLALGYQSLESYCLTEFGKGKARVYQLIEEAKIEEGITAELAASDSPIKSLKMPGTYLRELKVLETPRQQIEAIAYANKLAQNEGKTKATKTHLQAAVNKLNPKKTEQTREIFKTIGFDKGAEVEVLEGRAKGERGIIRKVDKKGAHVELYSGNSMPIAWDISELRIVPETDRPKHPATMDTINIGDTVRIFSSNKNKGKTGEIAARINDKIAVVRVETGNSEIPYAELEKVEIAEETQEQTTDLIWAGSWNPLSSWYYNVKRQEIHSFLLPDLTFQPPAKSSPSDWLEKWRQKNIVAIADALFTTDDLATLVLAATSTMSPEEKETFWAKVNVSKSHSETVQLRIENDELRTQLAESENAIQSMIADLAPSALASAPPSDFLLKNTSDNTAPGEDAPPSDFLLENTSDNTAPGEDAPPSDFLLENTAQNPTLEGTQTDWRSILVSNNFTSNYHYTDDCTEEYRGWTIYIDPNGGYSYIDLNHPEKGNYCCDIHFLSVELDDEDEIIKWTKEIVNQIEDFCPGQLSIDFQSELKTIEISAADKEVLSARRKKIAEAIEKEQDEILLTNNRKKLQKLKSNLKNLTAQLLDIDKFEQFKSGDTVIKTTAPQKKGNLLRLELTESGMPFAWVEWLNEHGEAYTDQHPLRVLTNLSQEVEQR